jgi:hypothetical protein
MTGRGHTTEDIYIYIYIYIYPEGTVLFLFLSTSTHFLTATQASSNVYNWPCLGQNDWSVKLTARYILVLKTNKFSSASRHSSLYIASSQRLLNLWTLARSRLEPPVPQSVERQSCEMGGRNHNSIPCETRDLYFHTGLSSSASLLASGFWGGGGFFHGRRSDEAWISCRDWERVEPFSYVHSYQNNLSFMRRGPNTQPYGQKEARRYGTKTCFFFFFFFLWILKEKSG